MRMSMGLQARQLQTQKLAPRMIQSMEILQLPALALQERIEQEMNENPLLEQQDVDPLAPDETEDEFPTKDTRSEDEKELVVDNGGFAVTHPSEVLRNALSRTDFPEGLDQGTLPVKGISASQTGGVDFRAR